MITIRTSIYESNKSVEKLFSRLGLDVEPVRELFTGNYISDKTIDTNRRWVGKVSEHERAFEIIKPNPPMNFRILEGNFYNMFVLGRIYSEESGSRIEVRFQIGIMATLGLAMACFLPLLAFIIVSTNDVAGNKEILLSLLTITVPGTLLLLLQLNHTEKEIMQTLGVR